MSLGEPDGYGEATGSTVVSWAVVVRPTNDDFADAEPISGPSGSTSTAVLDATSEPGEPEHDPEFSVVFWACFRYRPAREVAITP